MSYQFHSNNPNFLVQSALHNGSRTQDFYQHGQHNIMQAAAVSLAVFWPSDFYFHLCPLSLSLVVMKGPIAILEMTFSVLLDLHPSRCCWHQIPRTWNFSKKTYDSKQSWKLKGMVWVNICGIFILTSYSFQEDSLIYKRKSHHAPSL